MGPNQRLRVGNKRRLSRYHGTIEREINDKHVFLNALASR